MSNITQISTAASRDDEVGRWIAKIDRGITDSEKEDLKRWLSNSTDNYQSFIEMAEFWDEIDTMSILSDIFPISSVDEKRSKPIAWAIAATLVLAIASAMLLMKSEGYFDDSAGTLVADLPVNVFSTRKGEQATFVLPDGSTVVLNTDSLVSINFTDANRIMRLDRGEIHVSVAHETRPLSVLVGDQIIQALGTEFNIEITSDQSIELVVTEGLVVVGFLDVPLEDLDAGEPVELAPTFTLVAGGEEAVIRHVEETLQKIETEEIETEEIAVKLSWRNGNIIFTGETLEEAVQEVERYTAVEFVFLDEDSKQEEIAGFFKAGDVEGLLAVLRQEFEISYQWVGDHKVELASATNAE
jgi:transmembrane sensor